MTEKWADHAVVCVRYNTKGSHIAEVQVFDDAGNSFTNSRKLLRSEVISMIRNGMSFITAPPKKGEPNKYRKGSLVHIVTVDGNTYIRTDSNSRASDNLGELPEY